MIKAIKNYYRFIFKHAFEWFKNTFSVIGIIGIFISFNLSDLLGGETLEYVYPIILGIGIYYIALVVLLSLFTSMVFAMNAVDPERDFWKKKKCEILMTCNKGLYVYKQLELIKEAQTDIWCSIHSLSDENKKREYREFDEALEKATDKIKNVRVLAPYGIDRAQGAYQLATLHHVDIRFAQELEIEDLRFVLVDKKKMVFSQQKHKISGLSGDFSVVESSELGKLLEGYLIEIWNDPSRSLSYHQYLVKCAVDLLGAENIDLEKAAQQMKVPLKELEKAFKCEKCTYSQSNIIIH